MEKKTFMITGGNFTNKGAQSMIMITVSEIRKRFSDADIYTLPNDDYRSYDTKNLRFSVLRNHTDFFLINCGFLNKLKLLIKNVVRFCLMRDVYIFKELRTYTDTIKKIDCILDISGFCLSSQFETEYNMMLLNIIKEGKKYDIPVILLPQSFGPFDYKENKDKMLKLIKNELSYPYAVFAREKNGYKLLKSVLRDDHNLRLSSDLVLQNKDINLSDIFVKVPKMFELKVMPNSVAVIPNSMNSTQGKDCEILCLYRKIIMKLLEYGKQVYVLYHSSMDREYCVKILENFKNTEDLHFIDHDIDCYEYDSFVSEFDYIVASRYHSIVHSYRNHVPAVILGWASKYKALATLVNQENLVLDTREDIDDNKIFSLIEDINIKHNKYKQVISDKMFEIQKHNCFDVLNQLFDSEVIN